MAFKATKTTTKKPAAKAVAAVKKTQETEKKAATKKTTTTVKEKKVETQVDEAAVIGSAVPRSEESRPQAADAVSIDDLVGAPVVGGRVEQSPKPSPVQRPRINASAPQSNAPVRKVSQSRQSRPVPQAMPQSRQRFVRQTPPSQRGGFRQNNGGMRTRMNGGSRQFTQDIDVPTETVKGILDVMQEGHGFLRPQFRPSEQDVYISVSQIRRFLLRNGDMVEGQARPPKENERYWGLLKVEKINSIKSEKIASRPKFSNLLPVYPNKQLMLEIDTLPLSNRIIDLMAPIGFGQRGLIVSPPKAGKTTILKEIAAGIADNYPDVHLMAALIGERPEEVTDLKRSIKGEVLASNFDESPAQQTRIAEIALDRARRLVEIGKDVVILLDSITRLARAYNLVVNPSGRTLSGGFDPAALYPAKRFLGAARCVEAYALDSVMHAKRTKIETDAEKEEKKKEEKNEVKSTHGTGGSLTVIGTALVDTGSRMDELIYEEFKGTGNMELHLSRSLQERRVFPAIDIARSGTRHDELLLSEDKMKKITTLRHMLSLLNDEERTMTLVERLKKTKSNKAFLTSLGKGE